MDAEIRNKKILIFAGAFAASFVGLHIVGNTGIAVEELTVQLKALLSTGISGVFSILFRTTPNPEVDRKDSTRIDSDVTPIDRALASGVSESVYNAAMDKIRDWEKYGKYAEPRIAELKSAFLIYETRQAVLRISLFGIFGLATLMSFSGFLAPKISSTPVLVDAFLSHLCYLAIPFAVVGAIMGIAVCRVRAETDWKHAVRCSLMASSVISVGSFIVSLPYVFNKMYEQPIEVGGITMPMLFWMAIFRLFAAPTVAVLCGFIGFKFAEMLASRNSSNLSSTA